jgi:hypothetical protein
VPLYEFVVNTNCSVFCYFVIGLTSVLNRLQEQTSKDHNCYFHKICEFDKFTDLKMVLSAQKFQLHFSLQM